MLNWFTNQIVYNQHTFDNIYDNSKKINVLDYIQEPIKLNNEENNIGLDMNENSPSNEKFVTPEKVSMVVNTHILHKETCQDRNVITNAGLKCDSQSWIN